MFRTRKPSNISTFLSNLKDTIMASTTNKTPKDKKPTIALTARITTQLDRAVLGKKVSGDELAALVTHITKLQSFLK